MPTPEDPARTAVRQLVRQTRTLLGLSSVEAARSAQISPKTLYNLETGRSWPHPRALRGVERALGMRLGALDQVLASEAPEAITPADLQPERRPVDKVTGRRGPASRTPLGLATEAEIAAELLGRITELKSQLAEVTAERDGLRDRLGAERAALD